MRHVTLQVGTRVAYQANVEGNMLHHVVLKVDDQRVPLGPMPGEVQPEKLNDIGDQVRAYVGTHGAPQVYTCIGDDEWVAVIGRSSEWHRSSVVPWDKLAVVEVLNRRNEPPKQPSQLQTLGIGAMASIFCSACEEYTLQIKIYPHSEEVWMCQYCTTRLTPDQLEESGADLVEIYSYGTNWGKAND